MSSRIGVVELCFFAAVFTVTFAKLQWEVAGSLSLSDVLTALFLIAFAIRRLERFDGAMPRATAVTLLFFLAFLLVYLIGFFNLDTAQSLEQWAKGMAKFVLHFLFLAAGISLIARHGQRFYWLTLGVFVAGIAFNALYGVAQLVAAELTGANLDETFVIPLTGRATQINIFGAIEGASVYRPNALTGDPNHLGIELIVPLLVLLPIYLRLERGHRWRTPLLLLLAFFLVIELATLSRSGLLGLVVGFAVLALPYRHLLLSARFLAPLAAVLALLVVVVAQRADFFQTVLRSRTSTEGEAASTHFLVYSFVPDVLTSNPLFGLGLNNFSVYYEFVTGRTNFGPHSYFVALLVESGIVGAALFVLFVVYLFRRLALGRRLGRALAAARDPLAARVRPLSWGLTAALAGTLAANTFYLTISFYYFFVVALLAIAVPTAFARSLAGQPPT